MIGDLLAKIAMKQDLTPGEIEELRLGANSMKALTDLVSGWQTLGMNDPAFESLSVGYLEFVETPRHAVIMWADPVQSLTSGSTHTVTFASALSEVPSGKWFDDSVSDTNITIPVDGTYIMGGWTSFTARAGGARYVFVSAGGTNYAYSTGVPGALFYDYLSFFDVANLKAGTKLKLKVIQDCGSPLYLGETKFSIVRIGEKIV